MNATSKVRMQSSHVLVPMDGSPLAEKALRYAIETFECRVTVLNVITPLDSPLSEGGVLESDEERIREAEERAERLIESAKSQTGATDLRIETVIQVGDPTETILEYVETHDIDQVVMGGHGGSESRLARRLLGTVTTAVIGDEPVTVTVVK